MSADKDKSVQRRLELLGRMVLTNPYWPGKPTLRFSLHAEGGIARNNPDLQRLIKDGMVRVPLSRGTPPKKFKSKFNEFYGWKGGIFDTGIRETGGSICGHAPRYHAYVTQKGINFFNSFNRK